MLSGGVMVAMAAVLGTRELVFGLMAEVRYLLGIVAIHLVMVTLTNSMNTLVCYSLVLFEDSRLH